MSEPISSPSSVPGAEAKPAVTYAFDDPDNPEYISGDKIGIVTGGTLAAALAAGFLYHFGAQFYDSFMYVPLFAGLAAGLLLSLVFRMAKLNAMVPVAVCGIAAGLLTYVVRYELTALADRPFLVQRQIVKRAAADPQRDESAIRADVERDITPLNVIPIYLDAVAESGVMVGRRSGSSARVVNGNDYKGRVGLGLLGCVLGSFYGLKGAVRPKKDGA